MVLQKDHLRKSSVGRTAAREALAAKIGQTVTRLGVFNPYGVRKKLFRDPLSLLRAGQSVDEGRMHVKHEGVREKIVQQRLDARSAGLAGKTGRHHIGKNGRLAFGFVFGILFLSDKFEFIPVHADELCGFYRRESGTRALDVQDSVLLVRRVPAAGEDE